MGVIKQLTSLRGQHLVAFQLGGCSFSVPDRTMVIPSISWAMGPLGILRESAVVWRPCWSLSSKNLSGLTYLLLNRCQTGQVVLICSALIIQMYSSLYQSSKSQNQNRMQHYQGQQLKFEYKRSINTTWNRRFSRTAISRLCLPLRPLRIHCGWWK